MPIAPGPPRRVVFLILAASATIGIIFVAAFRSHGHLYTYSNPSSAASFANPAQVAAAEHENLNLPAPDLTGHAIAPKLGNETAKAELGRASWKLFHTIMARFPDKPTADESAALKDYVHLFQRLYPCGECASHFGEILSKYPPQVSSRSTAAAWACHVHNEVNKSLKKDLFDCANIGDFYDCGCAEDEDDKSGESKDRTKSEKPKSGADKPEMGDLDKEILTGSNGRDVNEEFLPKVKTFKIPKDKWKNVKNRG